MVHRAAAPSTPLTAVNAAARRGASLRRPRGSAVPPTDTLPCSACRTTAGGRTCEEVSPTSVLRRSRERSEWEGTDGVPRMCQVEWGAGEYDNDG
jgi:hypothetical protein